MRIQKKKVPVCAKLNQWLIKNFVNQILFVDKYDTIVKIKDKLQNGKKALYTELESKMYRDIKVYLADKDFSD